MKPEAIGIIGGAGRMGRWFRSLFEEDGYTVIISDLKEGMKKNSLKDRCNVIILSLPVKAIECVVKEIGPFLERDSLLMDIASLKEGPVRLMMENSRAEIIGTHPLFGPDTPSPADQILFVCPARVKLWDGWFRNFFSKKGIQIVEIEPQEHDRLMATIQSLRHIIITILGSSLMRSNFDLGGNLHISGQWFRMLIDVLRRQFQQPPQLYVDLLLNNPFVQEVSRALRRSAEEILNGIESGDKDLLLRLMDDVASYLKGHS